MADISKILLPNGTVYNIKDAAKTDTKVKQTQGSANATYPILASALSNPTSGTAYEAIYDTGIKINPNKHSVAEGSGSATGNYSHAEGYNTLASGSYSHAEGNGSQATKWEAHAEGDHTVASNEGSHAEGFYAIASGRGAHAEGFYTTAEGQGAHAEGVSIKSVAGLEKPEYIRKLTSQERESIYTERGDYYDYIAKEYDGSSAHAGIPDGIHGCDLTYNGRTTKITLTVYSGVVDGDAFNVKDDSVLAGLGTTYTSEANASIKYPDRYGKSSGSYAHSEGYDNIASGHFSHAEGEFTNATGRTTHAEGYNTIASGDYSHAEGYGVKALAKYSHVEGQDLDNINLVPIKVRKLTSTEKSNVLAQYGLTFNYISITFSGSDPIADGGLGDIYDTSGNFLASISLAMYISSPDGDVFNLNSGSPEIASSTAETVDLLYTRQVGAINGEGHHVEGMGTQAVFSSESGLYKGVLNFRGAHVEGQNCVAASRGAHAEGDICVAIGESSHAEGCRNVAYGKESHVEGYLSVAKGNRSHVEGEHNIGLNTGEHVEGKYNQPITGSQHTVGIGTSITARKNAHVITTDGKHYIPGVGGYIGTETSLSNIKDLATVLKGITDETVEYYDMWWFERNGDYDNIYSDNEGIIINDQEGNVNIPQLPAIIKTDRGYNRQRVTISSINGEECIASLWASQYYFIGKEKFSGELSVINISNQLFPLPLFDLVFGTGGLFHIKMELDNISEEYKNNPEYRILLWRLDNNKGSWKYFDTTGDSFGETHVIDIIPEMITNNGGIYNIKNLLLRGIDSYRHGQYSVDENDEPIIYTDVDELELLICDDIENMYESLCEDYINEDTLESQFFGYPFELRILTQRVGDDIEPLDHTSRFSTKFGVTIARCLIDEDEKIVGIMDQTEMKFFYGQMRAIDLGSENPKIEYSTAVSGKCPHRPKTNYKDIKSLFN